MTLRNYRFEIDTPVKAFTSIIIRSDCAENARSDAYTALHSVLGPGCRVKTSAADAKVMRRMPNNLEAVRNCYSANVGQWAWLVYTGK